MQNLRKSPCPTVILAGRREYYSNFPALRAEIYSKNRKRGKCAAPFHFSPSSAFPPRPSFQPRLNHGKMIHNHFPSNQQPRSNHEPTILRVEYKNDSISTQPSYITRPDPIYRLHSTFSCLQWGGNRKWPEKSAFRGNFAASGPTLADPDR